MEWLVYRAAALHALQKSVILARLVTHVLPRLIISTRQSNSNTTHYVARESPTCSQVRGILRLIFLKWTAQHSFIANACKFTSFLTQKFKNYLRIWKIYAVLRHYFFEITDVFNYFVPRIKILLISQTTNRRKSLQVKHFSDPATIYHRGIHLIANDKCGRCL